MQWKWTRTGTQGDQWKIGQYNIKEDDGIKLTIIFVGIRGRGYRGDIALDDISFVKGHRCEYSKCKLKFYNSL